jgi:NADH-quinone oxidoreductase subunit A
LGATRRSSSWTAAAFRKIFLPETRSRGEFRRLRRHARCDRPAVFPPAAPLSTPNPLLLLAIYLGAIVGLVALMLGLSYVLGQRHAAPATVQPYESGMIPVDDAHLRFPAQFYLVAMFFVVFDLEVAFIYAWAIAAREAGWAGYLEMLVFVAILLAALAYLWRVGALDWGPHRRTRRQSNGAERMSG